MSQNALTPVQLTRFMMYHLAGTLPQLRPYSRTGPTLYALTIFGCGARKSPMGGATLCGPAVDAAGLGEAWPEEARKAAAELFAHASARRAGAVTVIAIIQVGRVSHCSLINMPLRPSAAAPGRKRPRARSPYSCAAGRSCQAAARPAA